MIYFLNSTYNMKLFSKCNTSLIDSKIIDSIEGIFLKSEDRLILDEEDLPKIPNWVPKTQITLITNTLYPQKGYQCIYKYQSYMTIISELLKYERQLISILSDTNDPQLTWPCEVFSQWLSQHKKTILIQFSMPSKRSKKDFLFEMSILETLTLQDIESYLEKDSVNDIYKLTLYGTLKDFLNPPKELILNIIGCLHSVYTIVLNLIPLKNALDLEFLTRTDKVIYFKQLTTDQLRQQLVMINPNCIVHEVTLDVLTADALKHHLAVHQSVFLC